MAERFRIDLGNDPLFGSQSIDPNPNTGINKTVVYDTAKQTFYYTGSYGGGGGGGTFVYINNSETPLIIAGGGGGISYNSGN